MGEAKIMTEAEFEAGYDGLHIPLTCENHPNLFWSCKKIALSKDKEDGKWRWNGRRHIFFRGEYPEVECECPFTRLFAVIGAEYR